MVGLKVFKAYDMVNCFKTTYQIRSGGSALQYVLPHHKTLCLKAIFLIW